MPDEYFHSNWDFYNHTLHNFLRTYMRLQNEFIKDFCTTKEAYIYTYATKRKCEDYYHPEDIFFTSYEICVKALKENELDDDPYDEIAKGKITRHRLYSSPLSFEKAMEPESIVFDKNMQIIDIEPSNYESEGDEKFLGPSYGFYGMITVKYSGITEMTILI